MAMENMSINISNLKVVAFHPHCSQREMEIFNKALQSEYVKKADREHEAF